MRTRRVLAGARLGVVAGVSAFMCTSETAHADEPFKERPAFKVRPSVDLPIVTISTVVAGSWLLRNESSPPACAPDCDPARVNRFDRWAAGRWSPTWRTVSDIGVATMLAGSVATLLVDEGLENGGSDLLVVGEAALLANASAASMMWLTRRARPFSYGNDAPLERRLEGNAAMSFFSGHTATSFAATFGLYRALKLKHPNSPASYAALATGLGISGLVGVSRILAGDHFPTDVIAGAAVGSALGVLVPSLHEWKVRPTIVDGRLGFVGIF